MMVITDAPDLPPGRLPAVNAWRPATREELTPGDSMLLEALGSGRALRVGDVADPGARDFWARLMIVSEAPSSQFDILQDLLRRGKPLPGPVACLALEGRNFRGHRGHSWMAFAGNLHLCLAFPASGLPVRLSAALTMMPAVAVAGAVRDLCGATIRPGIKWVNDIMVEGRKLGGVLTATQVLGDVFTHVLFGIGLNVAVAPPLEPSRFVAGTASLNEFRSDLTLADTLGAVLRHIEKYYGKLMRWEAGAVLEDYRAASVILGREVCVWEEDDAEGPSAVPLFRGVVRAILPDLSLQLEGVDQPVTRGRLSLP